MKKLFGGLAITCWLSLSANAQSLPPTRIHIFNGLTAIPIEIKTTLNEANPLRIRSRMWAIIQFQGDSLGFVVNDKPYFLHFEPGKQYYFVAQSSHTSLAVFTEKSEREFILTASVASGKGPEAYNLPRLNK
ncbi:hypothetical protein GCM10027592_47470 [Spirosoma flavus]